jgi:uncharacterized protein (TIGR02246 family)
MTSTDTATRLDPAAGEAAVTGVLRRLYQAWQAADADAIAGLFQPDCTSVLPGVFRQGRDEVRAYFAAGFDGPLKGSSVIDQVRSVRFAGPDAAIVISEDGILMAGEDSVPDGRRVRATWVLDRRDGEWGIAAYHNCSLHAG